MTKLKTPAQARADFALKGLSIAAWARDHQVSPSLVYQMLAGHPKYRWQRGKSHQVAVLLGLKRGELVERRHDERRHDPDRRLSTPTARRAAA